MELTTLERLVLLNMLPAEGDITTLRIVRELREALSFSEEEHARLDIRQDDGRLVWTDDGSTKEVDIGPKAHRLIAGQLESLNADGKLTEQHLPLCDTFGVE